MRTLALLLSLGAGCVSSVDPEDPPPPQVVVDDFRADPGVVAEPALPEVEPRETPPLRASEPCEVEYFDGMGGSIIERTTRDDEGRVLQIELRMLGAETPTTVITNEYDDAGNLLSKTHSDGEGRHVSLEEWTYDEAQAVIASRTYYGAEDRLASRVENDYQEGLLVEERDWRPRNVNGERVPDDMPNVRRLTYDAEGNLVREDFTHEGSQSVSAVHAYERGNRVRTEHQFPDGTIYRTEGWDYDDANRLVRSWTDELSDGTINSEGLLIYDAGGRIIRTEYDREGDGIVDLWSVLEWQDELLVRRMNVANGVTTWVTSYLYDEYGRKTAELSGSGTTTAEFTYECF